MSDYGDDYSDYGDEWFYVEEEYMAADDLAEHAVASPPPTTYGDEDMLPDWDRFDYFNDLEYASDGYDNATFQVHNAKDAKTGQKRKRVVKNSLNKKRRSTGHTGVPAADTSRLEHTPIVWLAQNDRELKPRMLDDNAQPYALLKNWREKLKDTPRWARGSSPTSPSSRPSRPGKGKAPSVPEPVSPPSDIDGDGLEEDLDGEDMGISREALMAALQRQLAAAGGPLSGVDPQNLLEFAMRMAADKDAGDDIAGEMAEAMLEGDEEEDDADAEENLLSWVAQQRNAQKEASEVVPKSPEVSSSSKRPPTPPSSEANRSVRASETTTEAVQSNTQKATSSLKRKAIEDPEAESSSKVTKKRVTRFFDAPTTASQARAATAKTTRTTRSKRS